MRSTQKKDPIAEKLSKLQQIDNDLKEQKNNLLNGLGPNPQVKKSGSIFTWVKAMFWSFQPSDGLSRIETTLKEFNKFITQNISSTQKNSVINNAFDQIKTILHEKANSSSGSRPAARTRWYKKWEPQFNPRLEATFSAIVSDGPNLNAFQ